MAMQDTDIADLEKLLKKARQKPLPFGLCLGKKPEDNVMCMDMKKSPEVMMRKAKAEGETSKLTFGTASVKGKILTLSLDGKMLPGLAKNMKVFMLKTVKPMKIVIADPNGNVLEEDGEDDGDTNDAPVTSDQDDEIIADTQSVDDNQDQGEDTETETDNPLMGQWAKVSTALDPHVTRFGASGHKKAAAIVQAWNGAKAAAQKGDYKTAMAVAAKVKPVVTAAPDTASNEPDTAPETNPAKAKWEAALAAMEPLYMKAMGNNPDNRTKLQAAWGMAVEKADAGDFDGGFKILQRLKPALDAAANATSSGQEDDVPKDVVAFQKSRVLWGGTKAKMRKELETLVAAIVSTCKDDEDLAEIAQEAPSLLAHLDAFDDQLETILDQITNSSEGPERAKLKTAAVSKIQEYQNALQSSFFADVDNNNGFAKVAVTSTASASLGKISQVLAA